MKITVEDTEMSKFLDCTKNKRTSEFWTCPVFEWLKTVQGIDRLPAMI
jgi:hypothetical protein